MVSDHTRSYRGDPRRGDDMTRLDEVHHRFADAANAGDAAGIVALYEPDAVIVERDGTLTRGTDAIRRHVDDLLALHPKMEIIQSRSFQNGDLALLCSEWRARVVAPDGTEALMRFLGSEVLKKQQNGSWRLTVDNPWGIEVSA
jgi:uncharacterized protein (TIGR02246 family)